MSEDDKLAEFLALVQTGALTPEEAAKLLKQGFPDQNPDTIEEDDTAKQKYAFMWEGQKIVTITGVSFAYTWDEAQENIKTGQEEYTENNDATIHPRSLKLIEQVPLGSFKSWWNTFRGKT